MPTVVNKVKKQSLILTDDLKIALKKAELSKSMTYDDFKLKINKKLKKLNEQISIS